MTPDLPPQNCFNLHMNFPGGLSTLDSGGNKPEKRLQISIAQHFSVLLSLGVSII